MSGVFANVGFDEQRLPVSHATTITHESSLETPPGRSLEIGVLGRLLAILFVSCARCERPTGFVFVGDLDRLSDADLAAVQQRIGLPPDLGPLRRVDDWRHAYPKR